MVRPEFFDDEKLSTIPLGGRLTFIGLWVQSDDYGVVKGHHRWLQNQIFPYGDVTPKDFDLWMTKLTEMDFIRPFEDHGERYYWIRNFLKHQKVNRPSETRNPPPPDTLIEASVSPQLLLMDETETETEVKRNRSKDKQKVSAFSPPGAGSENALESKIIFSCSHFEISEQYLNTLLADFPGLDNGNLINELKKMRDWLDDNPNKHKRTAKGTLKNPRSFIRNWLNRMTVNPIRDGKPNEPKGFAGIREYLRKGGISDAN